MANKILEDFSIAEAELSVAAAKNVNTAAMHDGVILNIDQFGAFSFNLAEAAVADDVNIIAAVSGGKWIRQDMYKFKIDGSGFIDNSILPVALRDGTTATTQSPLNASTKLATTAYVDSAVGLEDLWQRVLTDIYPKNAGDNLDIGAGGFKDTNVTTAIQLGDASNTAVDSSLGAAGSLLKGLNQVITSQENENMTGWISWGGAGAYFTFSGTTFTLLRGGTGRIGGQLITFVGSQAVTVTANKTAYVGIDISGTLVKIDYDAITEAAWLNNIFLFEALYTGVTNAVNIAVKENHPYDFPTIDSRYQHHNFGAMIRKGFGADIYEITSGTGAAATDRQIEVVGATVLEDHGLDTTIPDSGGAAVTFSLMYKAAGGEWYRHANLSEIFGYYNNAGTPTLIAQNKAAVYVAYVSKDTLNASTPTYFLAMSPTEYTNVSAAQAAIQANTIQRADNEFDALELAQLGYVIFSRSVTNHYIAETIREKSSPGTLTAVGGVQQSSHLLLSDLNGGAALDGGHSSLVRLGGRPGGQIVYGGTASGDDLLLGGSTHGTDGHVGLLSVTRLANAPLNHGLSIQGIGGNRVLELFTNSNVNMFEFNTSSGHPILFIKDNLGDTNITFRNASTTSGVRHPRLLASPNQATTHLDVVSDSAAGTDTGTNPLIRMLARINGGAVAVRPLWSVENNGVWKAKVEFDGTFANVGGLRHTAQITITNASSPYDDLSVTGVYAIQANTAAADITIRGFANGVDGQEIEIFKQNAGNNLIINHQDANGTQKIVTPTAAPVTLAAASYGGLRLRFNGTNSLWYVINY